MAEILRLSPAICAYPDETYENLKIEVVLPGVEKEKVFM
ncbi:Small heat shock protein [Methanosarcina mazei Tuc01]|uniref:Small heat shock protein n=1 Tax=Methanosarcina mazei Tuc01 TaxID=1236903 RepID=M1Q2B3_METMZ|nr:Small heat shock protein [Methanosarcina mazei Tuc01]